MLCRLYAVNSHKQRTFSRAAVVFDRFFNIAAPASELSCETVNAEKRIGAPVYQLAVNCDIVRTDICAAFLTVLVIRHQTFTDLALKTSQPWESSCVTYLSVNVPPSLMFQPNVFHEFHPIGGTGASGVFTELLPFIFLISPFKLFLLFRSSHNICFCPRTFSCLQVPGVR